MATLLVALATVVPASVLATDPPQTPPPAGARPEPEDVQPTDAATEARVEAVVAAARAYLGTPYRLGTEGPYTIDCSGLVFRAFANAGELRQIGGGRLRAVGYARSFAARGLLTTDSAQAERGDLVIYGNVEHIGIYLGDGRVISALVSGVTVHSLDGISMQRTGFLAVDWTGKRGPFRDAVLPIANEVEAPAALVPDAAWAPEAPAAEIVAGPAAELGVERVDLRTANSRTYRDESGTFTTELFSRPIHYLPADTTAWQPIDLRFHEPTGQAANDTAGAAAVSDTAPVSMALAEPAGDGSLLTLRSTDWSIGLAALSPSADAPAPTLGGEGRYADYRDLLGPGISLRVYPRADGFKAFIVLADEPESRSFRFALDSEGLTSAAELDGSVTLRDEAGITIARLPRPMLLDSSDVDGDGGAVRPGVVTLVPELSESGGTELVLTIERGALEEAIYPAYVDLGVVDFPTTDSSAFHTFAASAHPRSNFSTYQRPEAPGYAELWHGRRPGRDDDNAAYLRFPGLASLLHGTTVESASLAALPYWQGLPDAASASWLGRVTEEWDVRGLTWDLRPAAVVDEATYDTTQGEWSAIDVTAYVQDVLGGAADYGLVLHADDAGRGHWKRLVAESTTGAGTLEPRLVVKWSGLRPVVTTADVGASATTLAWTEAMLAPQAVRYQVQVSDDDFETVLNGTRVKGAALRNRSLDVAEYGLAPGVYAWRVRARYEAAGPWSAWSDAGTLVIVDAASQLFAPADAAPVAPPAEFAPPTGLPSNVEPRQTVVF